MRMLPVRSSTKRSADGVRSSVSFASACRIAARFSFGSSRVLGKSSKLLGSSVRCAVAHSSGVDALKGRTPVNISYVMSPKA